MKKNNKVITIILILIMILLGAYFIISSRIDAKYQPNYTLEDFYEMPKRKVGVNEYTVASVDEEDMVVTYFNTYVMMFFENIDEAYSLLDEYSSLETYPNIEEFKKKVSSLTVGFTEIPKINEYSISKDDDGHTVYTVSDKKGNIYTFTIEAVMKYTVTI